MISENLTLILGVVAVIAVYLTIIAIGYYVGVKQEKELAEVESNSQPHFLDGSRDPADKAWALEPNDIDKIEDWERVERENE